MSFFATRSSGGSWLRGVAFAAGFALVAIAVLSWRIPGGDGRPGADVVIAVAPSGEIGVSPTGPIVRASNLRGGDGAKGSVDVLNQTGATLAISVRALPSSRDLDSLLQVTLVVGEEPLFKGPLGLLRNGTNRFVLDSGRTRRLEVEAWLAHLEGSEARVVTADLEFDVQRRS